MHKVSQSVIKKDHAAKIEGRSVYVSDYTAARDGRPILTGKLLRSEKARARILSVTLPPCRTGICMWTPGTCPAGTPSPC